MNKLAAILYFTDLTINDIINLRASAFPLMRGYYRREKKEVNQQNNLYFRNKGHKASSPYVGRDKCIENYPRQSLFEGAAKILLKAQYYTKADFWDYLHQERDYMLSINNRRWQSVNAPWQIVQRDTVSSSERLVRKQKAMNRRENYQPVHCPIAEQERRAFNNC